MTFPTLQSSGYWLRVLIVDSSHQEAQWVVADDITDGDKLAQVDDIPDSPVLNSFLKILFI